MTIDIESLSLRELGALVAAAEQRKALITTRRPAAAVRRLLKAAAAEAGYTIEELFGEDAANASTRSTTRRRKGPKVKPKYRDPESPWNTWTGRGKMPLWLASKIRFGQNPVDFLIPGVAKLTPNDKPLTGKRKLFKQS